MTKRRVYDVKPTDAGWQLKERGAQRAVGTYDTKDQAVSRGRAVAGSQDKAQLIIRGLDNKIQTEHTYGSDPYPPKG